MYVYFAFVALLRHFCISTSLSEPRILKVKVCSPPFGTNIDDTLSTSAPLTRMAQVSEMVWAGLDNTRRHMCWLLVLKLEEFPKPL
jgi:hypothetical protein